MTTSRTPAAIALVLGTLVVLGSSCTAILAPRDDVQRCGTADDCDPTGDNRYIPVCKFDDANVDLDSSQIDKICVADFKRVGCDPNTYPDLEHPFRAAFDELSDASRYVACDDTILGQKGCPPAPGAGCAQGLQMAEDTGLCDDTDDNTPKVYRIEETEQLGQDVRDQFCRSFFCDDRFVCDTGSNLCVICDPDETLGEGGCGEVYIAGAPSCVYGDTSCPGPTVKDVDVRFGACM